MNASAARCATPFQTCSPSASTVRRSGYEDANDAARLAHDPMQKLLPTTVSSTLTSPALQRQYIIREAQLLDAAHAVGWFLLAFTDLDLAVWPAGIAPFAYLGIVDVELDTKPALAPGGCVFRRPRD